MGEIAAASGDFDGAESALREALGSLQQLPDTHWLRGNAESALGAVLLAQGDTVGGPGLLARGYSSVSSQLGPGDPLVRMALTRMAALATVP